MSQRGRFSILKIEKFSDGLNTRFANTEILSTESPDLENILFDFKGEIRKRNGYEQVGDSLGTGSKVNDQFIYRKNDGTQQQIVASGTTLKYRDYPDGTTWTDIKTGLVDGARFSFIEIDDLLYCNNGRDTAFKWNGSTATDTPGVPNGNIMVYFQEKLWVAGDPNDPSILRHSTTNTALGDVENFTTGDSGFLLLGKDDGSAITALGIIGQNQNGSIVVFKRLSTYQVYFEQAGSAYAQQIIDTINGCVSKDAVVRVQNDLFYFSGTEVRRIGFSAEYFDQVRTNPVTEKIRDQIENLSNPEATNLAFFDDKLYIAVQKEGVSFPVTRTTEADEDRVTEESNIRYIEGEEVIADTVNTVYVLDTRYDGWSKWTGIRSTTFLADKINNVLFFGDFISDTVFKFNSGFNDDGAPIKARWKSKRLDMDDPHLYKRFRWLYLTSRNVTGSTLTYNISVLDNLGVQRTIDRTLQTAQETPEGVIGVITPGEDLFGGNEGELFEDPDFIYNRVSLGEVRKGISIQFEFKNEKVDEDMSVQSMTLIFANKDLHHYPSSYTR